MDNTRKDIDVILSCNLSNDTYEIMGDYELFLANVEKEGTYNEFIAMLADTSTGKYAEMLISCFSSFALLSEFKSNPKHNFCNIFFKYTTKPDSDNKIDLSSMKWAAFIIHIYEAPDGDIMAAVTIRSIGDMYNECEIKFVTDIPNDASSKFENYFQNIKLAFEFDVETRTYESYCGSILGDGLDVSKSGSITSLIRTLTPYLDKNADLHNLTHEEFIELSLSSAETNGGYANRRFLLKLGEEKRWHEYALISINEFNSRYIVTLKDIHEVLGKKLYGKTHYVDLNSNTGKNISNDIFSVSVDSSRYLISQIQEPFCVVSVEPGFPVRASNDAFYKAIGYSPENFEFAMDNRLTSLCHPVDIPYVRQLARDAMANGKDYSSLETRIIRGDSVIRWFKVTVKYVTTPLETLAFLSAEDITDKKTNDQSQLSDRHSFNLSYARSTNIIFDYDCKTDILKDRGGLAEVFGFPPEIDHFKNMLLSDELVSSDDAAELNRVLGNIRSGSESISGSFRIKTPNHGDDFVQISFTLSTIFDYQGQAGQVIGVIDKMAHLRANTADAAKTDRDVQVASQIHNTALFKMDPNSPMSQNVLANYTINLTTDTIETYSGLSNKGISLPDFTGQSMNDSMSKIASLLVAESYIKQFVDTYNTSYLLEEYDKGNKDLTMVFPLSHPSLINVWIKIFTHIAADEDGSIRALMYACDVTEEYRKISALENVSSKDPLTGLMNRNRMQEIVSSYLISIPSDELCAFMIIDLDNFKEINDIYGHQTGDDYLRDFAHALSEYLPDADVARLGGDEFVVFLKRCNSTSQISNKALTILKIIKDVNHSRITAFNTTGSIGIALAPAYGRDFDTLYHNADSALYEVKNNSKDGFMFCDDDSPVVHHSSETNRASRFSFRKTIGTANYLLYTILVMTVIAAFAITFGIFQSSSADVFNQANEGLKSHAELSGKYVSLYLDSMFQDMDKLAQVVNDNQSTMLNTYSKDWQAFKMLNNMVADTSFSDVYVLSDKGTTYYHYGSFANSDSKSTVGTNLINEVSILPVEISSLKVKDGSMVIARNIYNGNKRVAVLVCIIDGSNVSSYLENIISYSDEQIFLTNSYGIVVGSTYRDYRNLSSTYPSEYLTLQNFKGATDLPHLMHSVDKVNNPTIRKQNTGYLLSGTDVRVRRGQIFLHYYVVSVIPQESVLSNLTISLKIIMLLACCLFAAIGISTILIIRSSRKANRYVDNLAYKDTLTSLNNMNYLTDNSKTILKRCGEPCGIVSLNVDNFRVIRDAYGPAKSNKLITCIGNAISDFIGSDENAGRIVDDRYCLVLTYAGETTFTNKLKDLRSYIFSNCATYMATPVNFTISMGVYICESISEPIKQSFDLADLARTYQKDANNKDGIYYYDSRIQQSIQKQKILEDSLDSALENGEFVPYYQPIVSVSSRKIVACEALARWIKPDGSMVPPNEFIPLLEKRGSVVNLDYSIFEKVCAQLQIWKDTPLDSISVSINMSRQHFYQPDFVERLMRTTAKYAIPNSRIHIEITESIYVSDDILINKTLTELRDNGFLISMDDFGTGYSSMSMLQTMPIDILKIDKQFLDSSLKSNNGIIVLDGIVNISKQLGLKTICEGVETSEQLNWLKTVGCDMVQGYYYSKPVPNMAFEKFYIENTNA